MTPYKSARRKRVKAIHAQKMVRLADEARKSPKGERIARFIGLLNEHKAKQKDPQ
jgi:hypothetical protein